MHPENLLRAWIVVRSATLGLLAAVSLAACDAGPTGALRVGLLVWPPYELASLARDLGYLDGAAIELVDYESPAAVQRAYLDGALDAVLLTADYLLQMAAGDDTHRIVMVVDFSAGGDVLMARGGIDSVAALEGRRVGVEKSALGAYVLFRALQHAGLDIDDVRVVPADIPDQERLFRDGELDAVVTYEPIRTRLLTLGANELFSSRELPGEIVDVLISHRGVIDTHGEHLETFVQGWMRALAYLRANPHDAAVRVAQRQGLSPAAYLAALDGVRIPDAAENRALLAPGPASLSHALERLADVMLREGLLPTRVATAALLEPRFVDAVEAR